MRIFPLFEFSYLGAKSQLFKQLVRSPVLVLIWISLKDRGPRSKEGVNLGVISFRSNIYSLNAQRHLAQADARVALSNERLSSGQRINRASDDAAGLSISSSLRLNRRVFSQAIRNGNDGISALNIAGGAINQLSGILMRLKELASQSANGAFSRTQRIALDAEGYALTNEYNRMIQSTKFNGLNLLNNSLGNMSIQLGFGTDGQIGFNIGSEFDRAAGTGSFGTGTLIASGNLEGPLTAFGDVNRDGYLDMISTNDDGVSGYWTSISLGNGNGTFQAATTLSSPTNGSYFVQLGDVNGDGLLDLVHGTDTSVLIRLGNGNGTFQAETSLDTGVTISSQLKLGDLNSDGKLDIVNISGTSAYVLLNNGNGTFRAGVSYTAGSGSASSLNVADMNGDGIQDIITRYSDGMLNTLMGRGDGTFAPKISSAHGLAGTLYNTGVADLNYDGIMDYVVTSNTGSVVNIFLGNADGTFKARVSYAAGNRTGALGDINGDGIVDIVSAGTGSTVRYLLGNGDGTFQAAVTTLTGTNASDGLTLADLNNDGVLDLVGVNNTLVNAYLAVTSNITTISRINLTTQAEARDALTTLDAMLARVSGELGAIGSTQSRLAFSIDALNGFVDAYSSADSRITDVDIAQESAELVRGRILTNAASSVLAQANQLPEIVLALISNV
ncbi:MAG: hypothetical protein DCC75_04030 [Proteobacteria bacterium]|nr:MAG: hypothetical protein DCC75_04030 [Pseudomonadota bacterium]